MRTTMRTIATRAGAFVVESLEFIVMAAAAGLGGWVAYRAPGLPPAWAGASAGAFGLGLAVGVSELLDPVIAALRALTRTSTSPAALPYGLHPEKKEGLPGSTEDLMDRLAEAARSGAAHDAALFSGRVDPAGNLLDQSTLWTGIDGTSAQFPLADGAYLHYRKNDEGNFTVHEYTFVAPSTQDEPVPVTAMDQVRDLLEQHVNRQPEEEPVSV